MGMDTPENNVFGFKYELRDGKIITVQHDVPFALIFINLHALEIELREKKKDEQYIQEELQRARIVNEIWRKR